MGSQPVLQQRQPMVGSFGSQGRRRAEQGRGEASCESVGHGGGFYHQILSLAWAQAAQQGAAQFTARKIASSEPSNKVFFEYSFQRTDMPGSSRLLLLILLSCISR